MLQNLLNVYSKENKVKKDKNDVTEEKMMVSLDSNHTEETNKTVDWGDTDSSEGLFS